MKICHLFLIIFSSTFGFFNADAASGKQVRFSRDVRSKEVCGFFVNEYKLTLKSEYNIEVKEGDCDQAVVLFGLSGNPQFPTKAKPVVIKVYGKEFLCTLEEVHKSRDAFSYLNSYQQQRTYFFHAASLHCQEYISVPGGLGRKVQLYKKFEKYHGEKIEKIISDSTLLTSYYNPQNRNLSSKIEYTNGGSLWTPFAFKGAGVTFIASVDKEALKNYFSEMNKGPQKYAPVTFYEGQGSAKKEKAIAFFIGYNFHNSGVGPYSEFQVAPLIQKEDVTFEPFVSLGDFVAKIDSSKGKGLSGSFGGKFMLWQSHLVISSLETPFAELAIKGGVMVSYPKYLGSIKMMNQGQSFFMNVTQAETAAEKAFNLAFEVKLPKNQQALASTTHYDQGMEHFNYNYETQKHCIVHVRSQSRDTEFMKISMNPHTFLNLKGKSKLTELLRALKPQFHFAQFSDELEGATWTTFRECVNRTYDEKKYMNVLDKDTP